jgi:hypothetical protein
MKSRMPPQSAAVVKMHFRKNRYFCSGNAQNTGCLPGYLGIFPSFYAVFSREAVCRASHADHTSYAGFLICD